MIPSDLALGRLSMPLRPAADISLASHARSGRRADAPSPDAPAAAVASEPARDGEAA
jgi:hypothetical protein